MIGASVPFSALAYGAAATAVIGGALSLFWDAIKRRREADLASRDAFYRAYAEFFTTWKLWESHKRYSTPAPTDIQWQLLRQAEDAEATLEALLVKVTSEKKLDNSQCDGLAAFRQGYQSLRERIRSGEELAWWASDIHPEHGGYLEYRAFKILAAHFATLLVRRPRKFGIPRLQPKPGDAMASLLRATRNRREDWTDIATALIPVDNSLE